MENEIFKSLKTRWLAIITIALISLMYISFFIMAEITGINGEDAIYEVIGGYIAYLIPTVWIVYMFKKYKVNLVGFVYKPGAEFLKWWLFIVVVAILIFFSIGSLNITLIPFSYIAPDLVNEILNMNTIYTTKQTIMPMVANVFEFIVLALIAPIVEELVFRGILFNRFKQKWGIGVAIIVPSIIFGIMHADLIGAFVFAVIMTLLYIKTRNLIVPILCHVINNAFAGLIPFVSYLYYGTVGSSTVEELRSGLLMGILFFSVTTPLILIYTYKNWPRKNDIKVEEPVKV